MDLGLKGKVALVTGGSSGIGLAIAQKLAAEGCRIAICGRDRGKLDSATASLKSAKAFAADLCVPEDVASLAENVVAAFGGIDIVVSNAGTHLPGRLEDIDGDAMLEHFKTKVLGAWQLARSVLPHMRKKKAGRFIVIIGQAGKVPQANAIASTGSTPHSIPSSNRCPTISRRTASWSTPSARAASRRRSPIT